MNSEAETRAIIHLKYNYKTNCAAAATVHVVMVISHPADQPVGREPSKHRPGSTPTDTCRQHLPACTGVRIMSVLLCTTTTTYIIYNPYIIPALARLLT